MSTTAAAAISMGRRRPTEAALALAASTSAFRPVSGLLRRDRSAASPRTGFAGISLAPARRRFRSCILSGAPGGGDEVRLDLGGIVLRRARVCCGMGTRGRTGTRVSLALWASGTRLEQGFGPESAETGQRRQFVGWRPAARGWLLAGLVSGRRVAFGPVLFGLRLVLVRLGGLLRLHHVEQLRRRQIQPGEMTGASGFLAAGCELLRLGRRSGAYAPARTAGLALQQGQPLDPACRSVPWTLPSVSMLRCSGSALKFLQIGQGAGQEIELRRYLAFRIIARQSLERIGDRGLFAARSAASTAPSRMLSIWRIRSVMARSRGLDSPDSPRSDSRRRAISPIWASSASMASRPAFGLGGGVEFAGELAQHLFQGLQLALDVDTAQALVQPVHARHQRIDTVRLRITCGETCFEIGLQLSELALQRRARRNIDRGDPLAELIEFLRELCKLLIECRECRRGGFGEATEIGRDLRNLVGHGRCLRVW